MQHQIKDTTVFRNRVQYLMQDSKLYRKRDTKDTELYLVYETELLRAAKFLALGHATPNFGDEKVNHVQNFTLLVGTPGQKFLRAPSCSP
jgi:hypothetical protein